MKKILIIITILMFTGCTVGMHISDEELENYNPDKLIGKTYDEFRGTTEYETGILLKFKSKDIFVPNDSLDYMYIYKIIDKNGDKYTYGSITFNQENWMFVKELIFLFDDVPYKLNAEQQQRSVSTGARVSERYTFNLSDNFFKKMINAKVIKYKLYTTEQGEFTGITIDKTIPETSNYYKMRDKNFKAFLEK